MKDGSKNIEKVLVLVIKRSNKVERRCSPNGRDTSRAAAKMAGTLEEKV